MDLVEEVPEVVDVDLFAHQVVVRIPVIHLEQQVVMGEEQ